MELRWSPSTRPATASTRLPPPRPPPPAVPRREAPGQARAARARQPKAAAACGRPCTHRRQLAAPGYPSTAARPGPPERRAGADPASDSGDWKAWLLAGRRRACGREAGTTARAVAEGLARQKAGEGCYVRTSSN
eukprot:scaffold58995_cov58-Phaeocystis_antarctica.AAC.2